MTGPGHYQEAERLLDMAEHTRDDAHTMYLIGASQVHATLALAAATANQSSHIGKTQEAGRPVTVNETPAGARDLEGGASSFRTGEKGGAAGARADRPAPAEDCYERGCRQTPTITQSFPPPGGFGPTVTRGFCTRHAAERGLL